ncbi:hypothetical protein GOP47_0022956 [Adiantum capillus-veneris]|uniref:Uncharacterized protein n=1 Tax=Adiantum capillus-veneris TaxID=13818 RepID=A0A9D4U6T6_ADICA|nr:hypothetical protein GOP47_0022956 [Adiantum capillus-veneris]
MYYALRDRAGLNFTAAAYKCDKLSGVLGRDPVNYGYVLVVCPFLQGKSLCSMVFVDIIYFLVGETSLVRFGNACGWIHISSTLQKWLRTYMADIELKRWLQSNVMSSTRNLFAACALALGCLQVALYIAW